MLARVVAYVGLSVGMIVVERALAGHLSSHRQRPLAVLTDQLMMFGTMAALAGGLIGSVVLRPALIQPAWLIYGFGLFLGIAGLALRARAMRALGRQYTLTPHVEPQHVLISSGPYGLIRHPGYAAILLSILGLQAIVGTWVAVLSTLFVILPFPVRIRVEEEMLLERFGAEYTAYRSRTRYRLLPGVY